MTALLVLIYVAFISLGLPDSLLGSVWPAMHADLGADLSLAGVLGAVVCAGTVLSGLFSARMIARFGTARVTAVSVLMTAAAMAIGQSFKKNKGLMSVVFFFVLWIGTRIVLTLIFGAFYWPATSAVNTMTVLQALWTVLGCACVGALAFCVGFFFLTHGMLRKHLNLQ